MIPRKIHYCWFGENQLSDLNRRCIDSWQKQLPDYEFKLWNETNSPLNTDYARAAIRTRSWARLSNHVRYQAIYNEGGIYLDTDVEVLKDFAPLLIDKCFVGFQQVEEQTDWVNSAVLGAQAGHPFLKDCLDLTDELFARNGEPPRSPFVLTMLLKRKGLTEYKCQELDGVTIYPAEYFYPYPWFSSFSPDCVKENTYCVHYWEGSWVQNPARTSRQIVKQLLRVFGI